MDQVKEYLAVLKKHHFWPLCVVVLAAGFYAWRSGVAHYVDKFNQGKAELNGAFSQVENVARVQDHPNEYFITEVKQLNTDQAKDVMAAWQKLYDNQKQILVWPKEFAAIGTLKPDAEIPRGLRDVVFNYFKLQFPQLFAIVDVREEGTAGAAAAAEPTAADGGRTLGSGAGREKPPATGVVIWAQGDRNKIENAYSWSTAPNTKQIRYAQEDYWVYQALLSIISRTNRGVKQHHNAAIKKIEALEIAQAVPPANDFAFSVPDGTVAPAEERPRTQQRGQDVNKDALLDDGRYVSADGKPLSNPSSGGSKEFKLMPIRMRLVMDQRKLPDLLVECANSPLPVEVQRVQINPSESRSSPSSGGGGGGRGRGGRGLSGGGGAPQPAPAAAPAAAARGPQVSKDPLLDLTPNDQVIEIRGVIYIYNPPSMAGFAAEGESADDADAGQADDAEPAATETDEPAALVNPPADEPDESAEGDAGADSGEAAEEMPAEGTNEAETEGSDPVENAAADEPPADEPPAEPPTIDEEIPE